MALSGCRQQAQPECCSAASNAAQALSASAASAQAPEQATGEAGAMQGTLSGVPCPSTSVMLQPSSLVEVGSSYCTMEPCSEWNVTTGFKMRAGFSGYSHTRHWEKGGAYRCSVMAGPSSVAATLCRPRLSSM